jgi:hypothetical protein
VARNRRERDNIAAGEPHVDSRVCPMKSCRLRYLCKIIRDPPIEAPLLEAPDVQTAIEVGAELFDYPAWRLIAEAME